MKKTASLQQRLIVGVIGVALLVWLLAAGCTWLGARHELDELLDGHLAQAATLVINRQDALIEHPEQIDAAPAPRRSRHDHRQLHDDDDDEDEYATEPLHRYAPRVAFQIWQDGQLVARSTPAPDTPFAHTLNGFDRVEHHGMHWRVFGTPGRTPGSQVWVGERQDARDAILRAVLRGQLAPLALALPLLALAVWLAVRASLGPLHRLHQALASRTPQATDPLSLPDAPADLAPLVNALNGLFARMAEHLEGERRFTADAAHELRTPIAAIRAQAQVAQGAHNNAERQHALAATLTGCDRAAHLVDQLLTLSRLDHPETDTPPVWPMIDLVALSRRTAAELAPQMLDRRQKLILDAPTHCLAPAHETLLSVLLRNLLDNASRYSPDGATIELHLDTPGGTPRLRIADSGPGLSDINRARLGERFFRVLGSDQPGSGLGWSIVQRIAQRHSLYLDTARAPQLGGLLITITWPTARPTVP